MHDALLVDEITRRIAEQLFDDKRSSLAFSLCCQSLNEPVLDVLWKWQTDLVTLFKVLPPDLWEVGATVGLVSIDQWLAADRKCSPGCEHELSDFYVHLPPMNGIGFGYTLDA